MAFSMTASSAGGSAGLAGPRTSMVRPVESGTQCEQPIDDDKGLGVALPAYRRHYQEGRRAEQGSVAADDGRALTRA
ncbi:hypothetical protein E4U53_003689, partial [Claviceps sorghi]